MGKKCLLEFFSPVQRIHKGEQFCDNNIEVWRDFLVDIEAGQNLYEIRVILNEDIMLPGYLDDLLGDLPLSLGDHLGSIVFSWLILQCYSPLLSISRLHRARQLRKQVQRTPFVRDDLPDERFCNDLRLLDIAFQERD